MENVVKFLIDFILLFLIFYIVYTVFIYKKKKSVKDLKNTDIIYIFIQRYNIDTKKVKFKSLVRLISLINSLIISFSSTLILNINGFGWKLLVCFVSVFVLTYSLFEICGRCLKKKGGKK